MGIRDWSSDVCSSDLLPQLPHCSRDRLAAPRRQQRPSRREESMKIIGKTAAAGLRLLAIPFIALISSVCVAAVVFVRTCAERSEEHTSELQSLMRSSYAVFCLKKKKEKTKIKRQFKTQN